MVLKFPSFAKCCEKKITIGNLIKRLKISNNFKNKNKNKLHIYYIINLSNFDFSFPWAIISCFLSLSGRWDFCRVHSSWKNIRQLLKDSWTHGIIFAELFWTRDFIAQELLKKGLYFQGFLNKGLHVERFLKKGLPKNGLYYKGILHNWLNVQWYLNKGFYV